MLIFIGCALVFSVLLFICLFGSLPQYQDSILGSVRQKLLQGPRWLANLDQTYFDGRIQYLSRIAWTKNKNRLAYMVPLGYCLAMSTCLYVFYRDYRSQVQNNIQRNALIPIISSLPYVSLALAVFSDPGKITKQNHDRAIAQFPFDRIIFMPGSDCPTCKFEKPARSKHCSHCNMCYMLADHHCIWINNCVGYYNYRWFLFFLVSNLAVLVYGGWLLYHIVLKNYFNSGVVFAAVTASSADSPGPGPFKWRLWASALGSPAYKNAVCLLILCLTISITVAGFLMIHLRYIYVGATTNESAKWEVISDCIDDQCLYYYAAPTRDADVADGRNLTSKEPTIVLQKLNDGTFHRSLTQEERRRIATQDLIFRRVEGFQDIHNIYDHGFLNNLKELLFPHFL